MPLQQFHYVDDRLHCEQVRLSSVAQSVGTPAYVYSSQAIRDNYRAYRRAFAGIRHDIHYAVKANSSLAVLGLLASEGAGFDIVSAGELYRVLRAGGDPGSVVYSGVGKTRTEVRYALSRGIGAFLCESAQELGVIREEAVASGRRPAVGLRVNPDIDAKTHPYIATGLSEHKFGIAIAEAEALYADSDRWRPLRVTNLSCHIGSQIFDLQVFGEALDQLLALAMRLRGRGVPIRTIDLGGGLGVGYTQDQPSVSIEAYGALVTKRLAGTGFRLGLEPGRSIVGQAGALLTQVLYCKSGGRKTFVVVDGAMNDLIRPALYSAHHEVLPERLREGEGRRCDVVGPVCESGDFLATGRRLQPCESGDLLAIATAGAYGFVLSSNYNSRPRAAEVLVARNRFSTVRARETYEDLVRGETV